MAVYVNILGEKYTIEIKKYSDDKDFEKLNCDGYCDSVLKKISICDMHTFPGFDNASEKLIILEEKHILRHELVHAFLNESGLRGSALNYSGAWALNEEMIDWFATQGERIYKSWSEAEKALFGDKLWKV